MSHGRAASRIEVDCAPDGSARHPALHVELLDTGRNAIMVMKVVNTTFKTGLKEAKDIVDAPKPVRLTIDAGRAQELLDALVEAGARARIV